jgi:hypothetical protein
MNSHLNVFKTYTKKERSHQLENDLTRALAICLQEDPLFFHEVLKLIFSSSNFFTEFFDDINNSNEITIEIQKNARDIQGFEHVFAISLSENAMNSQDFWKQNNHIIYDPICDIVIRINNVVIIIEAKRDAVDCTAQLYNQIYNVFQNNKIELNEVDNQVTPFDLNWKKLMDVAVKVLSFERSIGSVNRFLSDFVKLVKQHNFKWLPEPALISIASNDTKAIKRRFESVLGVLDKSPEYDKLQNENRLGLKLNKLWAQEINYNIDKNGSLVVAVYPGNTKAQGQNIFYKDPEFKKEIKINGEKYPIIKDYHIKLNGQSYITGLWFNDKQLVERSNLYSKQTFVRFSGRRKKEDWKKVEELFDNNFNKDIFDWRAHCNWRQKILGSNRSQFDLSFGFELAVRIPFDELKRIDTDKNDITGLSKLVTTLYHELKEVILK